jgi:hypothetical protein
MRPGARKGPARTQRQAAEALLELRKRYGDADFSEAFIVAMMVGDASRNLRPARVRLKITYPRQRQPPKFPGEKDDLKFPSESPGEGGAR